MNKLMTQFIIHKIAYFPLFLIFVCMLTASCKSLPEINTSEPTSSLEPPMVLLGPGDDIEVKFQYWPELDIRQKVRFDGNISLMLINTVRVMGLTAEQLDNHLTKLYEGEIIDPDITVIVHSQGSQNVYVGGEVLRPGTVALAGRMNVLAAIMAVGGFDNETAELSNILLIQHVGDKRVVASLDMEKAFNEPSSFQYYLSPDDIVYVPPTRINKINIWVDQHLTQTIPGMLRATRTSVGISSSNTIGLTPRGLTN